MFYRKATTVIVETNGVILFKTNVIMSEQSLEANGYHAGTNIILWEQMLSCGNKFYHVGTNVIMREQMLWQMFACASRFYIRGKQMLSYNNKYYHVGTILKI